MADSASHHQRAFLPLLAALVALAWLTLWAWSRSPYGRYLAHGDWTADGPAAALCRAGGPLVPLVLTAAAWIVMTAAMMLPTTLPLFDTFGRVVARRPDRRRLLLLLGLGYMAAWGGFGMFVHGLHTAVLALLPVPARYGWLAGAATIALAGAFQFSSLKRRCLAQCRSPLPFVSRHWRGTAPAWNSFTLGAHHGLFCVGCCWALMLLMFVVGMGSLGWMLVLAAAMAVEKNERWGRYLGTPLGVALLAWAGLLVWRHA